jgi:hypothetical protein
MMLVPMPVMLAEAGKPNFNALSGWAMGRSSIERRMVGIYTTVNLWTQAIKETAG